MAATHVCNALLCKGIMHSRVISFTGIDDKNKKHELKLCNHHAGFNNPIKLSSGDSYNPGKGVYIPKK